MEKEMREQPGLLAELAPRYAEVLQGCLAGRGFDMVLLAARGSSDHAALYARYLIEAHLKVPAVLAAPSVLTRYGARVRYPRCLAVGISQSGAAPDVTEVIAAMREDGHATLAITNTPGSRLTEAAEHTLLLEAGDEKSIAATKTYTTSLLAMVQLVRALGGSIPDPVGSTPTESWMAQVEEAAEEGLGPLLRCDPLFSLARGWSFCTAHEAALKLMECALLPCKAYSTADFAHGPKALADSRTAALCFSEPPDDLAGTGWHVVQAPLADAGPLEPLWGAFFAQWAALLAARARGLDPDQAQNLNKVTKTL